MQESSKSDPLKFFRKGGGSFKKKKFEYRPAQEMMASAVMAALEKSEILIVEAGTGTGKTLAYLIPALHHARQNGKKVVVATETRSLQSQILESDVPAASQILKEEFRAYTAFGSGNYLCPRRLNRLTETGNIDIFMSKHLEDFLKWAQNDDEKIIFYYKGFLSSEFRSGVSRDKDDCPGRKCSLFDECPYYKARENWKKADLLLVNHSLLSTNAVSGNQLLPEFSYLIVDEAHRFPEIYEQSSRQEFSVRLLHVLIRQIQTDFAKSPYKIRELAETEIRPALENFEKEFSRTHQLVPGKTMRIREGLQIRELGSLNSGISQLLSVLEPLADTDEKSGTESGTDDETRQKYIYYYNKLKDINKTISSLIRGPENSSVHWVALNEKEAKPDPLFTIGRIGVGLEIRKLIIDKAEAAVFTSATLTTSAKDPFSYYLRELTSLTKQTERIRFLKLDSPFDYRNNCILFLPQGMPDPAEDEIRFHEKAAEMTAWLDAVSDGGMFVLFTSVRSLKEVHRGLLKLRPELEKRIISQTDSGPKKALDDFRNMKNPVLLGLASFWQGIDIPGDHLRQVVLVRIPFKPPDDPVTEALTEAEKKNGSIPFFTVQLPRAVIQIKQGFGRLIRTGSDRGAVTILDPRMDTKPYGKEILKSLPPAKVIRKNSEFSREYAKIMNYSAKTDK